MTLNELIDSISASLHSYSGVQEQLTHLTSSIDADELAISVGSTEAAIRGLIEIDNELIYASSADGGTITVPPFGRGFRGSGAASHDADAMVVLTPIFPRIEIKRAINECVAGLYPVLYAIKTTSLDPSPTAVSYELPGDCEGVLEVKMEAPAPLDYEAQLPRWKFDPKSQLHNSGKSLAIFDPVDPSLTLFVTYFTKFGQFEDGEDTFEDVGLDESYADLILYCVAARMIRFMDPARLQVHSVENISRAQVVAAGDAGKIANQLYAMYQTRLQEERRKLLQLVPPSMNFTR